jgi:hypothetical protein
MSMNVLFIVDSSLSTRDYLSLYSTTVNGIVDTYRRVPNINLSFYTFSTGYTKWFQNFNYYDLKGIGWLNLKPDGMTALYDSLSAILTEMDDGIPRLVIILTDGDDNRSYLSTPKRIRDKMTCLQERGWKFVFLGVNVDSMSLGEYMGCDSCVMYSPTEKCFNGILDLVMDMVVTGVVSEGTIDLTSMKNALEDLEMSM